MERGEGSPLKKEEGRTVWQKLFVGLRRRSAPAKNAPPFPSLFCLLSLLPLPPLPPFLFLPLSPSPQKSGSFGSRRRRQMDFFSRFFFFVKCVSVETFALASPLSPPTVHRSAWYSPKDTAQRRASCKVPSEVPTSSSAKVAPERGGSDRFEEKRIQLPCVHFYLRKYYIRGGKSQILLRAINTSSPRILKVTKRKLF